MINIKFFNIKFQRVISEDESSNYDISSSEESTYSESIQIS